MRRGLAAWALAAALVGVAGGGWGGCQQAPAAGDSPADRAGGAPGTGRSAAGGAKSSEVLTASVATWYTHEGAEKLYRQGKYADAEAMCKQAISEIEKAKGNKSPELAPPLIDLATVYMRLAKYADAKTALDRAESVLDPSKPDQALLLGRLGINKGWRLYTLGEPEAATKVFEDSRALVEKNSKGDSIDLAELINNVGLMYESTAEKEEDDELMAKARLCLLQGYLMRKRLTGDESPETAESLNNLGMHLLFNGNSPEESERGLQTLKVSLAISERVYGVNHPETAMAHAVLGLALFMHDDRDDAEKEVQIAIPVTSRTLGDMHPDRAFELMTMGHIYEERRQFDKAENAFLESLAIEEHTYGKTHPNLVPTLQALKALYDAKGDAAKAVEAQKRIEKLSGKDI